jgi:copper transport protein
MPRTFLRHRTLFAVTICAVVAGVVGLPAGTASAHNTLSSSNPAEGVALSVAPAQITWVFVNPVPLESMTVTLIDPTGARRELVGSTHGANGDTEVVTPLPSLQPGSVSLRWRLVGPDGHPITGRVDFTITAPAPTSVVATVAATVASATAMTLPPPTPTTLGSSSLDQADGLYSTPDAMRWILRYASYLAIMAIVGILLTSAYVWSGTGDHPIVRSILSRALFATAVLAFLQLLVIASDVSGTAPWSSFASIDAATTTDAGMALAIRIVLALTVWLLLFRYRLVHPDVYWIAVSLPGLGLLATWAFAGHSRSMRWPAIGIVTDVAHHGAAAAWIAGLAVVGWIVIPSTTTDVLVPTVRRFSRVAAVSVGVLVATGVVQSVRLVGNPMDLFDANHGRYLLAKIVVLAAMLAIASANRRRVDHRLDDPAGVGRHIGALRRAVVAEFAIGLVIVAITAAMVVSPPSTSGIDASAPADNQPTSILHDVVITTERPTR